MTKTQEKILNLAKALGKIKQSDVVSRGIPATAMEALIKNGVLISNVESDEYYIKEN